jgi:hypothetical protein
MSDTRHCSCFDRQIGADFLNRQDWAMPIEKNKPARKAEWVVGRHGP